MTPAKIVFYCINGYCIDLPKFCDLVKAFPSSHLYFVISQAGLRDGYVNWQIKWLLSMASQKQCSCSRLLTLSIATRQHRASVIAEAWDVRLFGCDYFWGNYDHKASFLREKSSPSFGTSQMSPGSSVPPSSLRVLGENGGGNTVPWRTPRRLELVGVPEEDCKTAPDCQSLLFALILQYCRRGCLLPFMRWVLLGFLRETGNMHTKSQRLF